MDQTKPSANHLAGKAVDNTRPVATITIEVSYS